MRSIYSVFIALLTAWLFAGHAFAYDETQRDFLLGLYFKSQILRDQAVAEMRRIDSEISKIDAEIKKNDATIQNSQQIISLAGQRTDEKAKKAEVIAREALMKAQAAKSKNETTRKELELKRKEAELARIRADRSYATIKNMLSEGPWGLRDQAPIQGFVSGFTGRVEVKSANGKTYTLNDPESPAFLKAGDVIQTYDNGKATFHVLGGRGDASLGPNSKIVVGKASQEEEEVGLVKGKLYITVNKIDDYASTMKEKYEQYKEDLKTVTDPNNLEDMYRRAQKIFRIKKFQILNLHKVGCTYSYDFYEDRILKSWCRTVVVGIRGTKLSLENKEDGTGELVVLEGVVDVSTPDGRKVFSLEGGQKVTFTKEGISSPQKMENIEKWWEE